MSEYVQGVTTTGGTGTLTITSDAGMALPAAAGVAGRVIKYSVVEYSSSSRSSVTQAEAGYGTISSGNVLTRSRPLVTWNGTTYDDTAPSALNFGTSHVVVVIAPLQVAGDISITRRYDTSAESNGVLPYVMPMNTLATSDFPARTLSANVVYFTPILLPGGINYTTLGVEVTTGAASSNVSCCIADTSMTNGAAGTILVVANTLSSASTGFVTASIDWTPDPGWYWFCVTSSGAPSLRGSELFIPGPLGIFNSRTSRGAERSRTYATFTVGNSAQTGLTGSWSQAVNVAYPIPFLR